ncbi:unnamed protein product [Symbiodinium sp. KB8]|nr:unnamed protein product [Symbiodinium sp. KB8]
MLNGRFLGVAFDFGREGISAPPLQPHICQGNGKAFSVLMRGTLEISHAGLQTTGICAGETLLTLQQGRRACRSRR